MVCTNTTKECAGFLTLQIIDAYEMADAYSDED